MRIISGKCRGRTIVPPKKLKARPTTDFAKENLVPGTYSAVIYLVPYDIETNSRAMLESQLPVTIEVR